MAINYPLTIPNHTGVASYELRAVNAVSRSMSPFTFSSTVYEYAGKRWELDVSLPPMKRADAEIWVAWLISLKGQRGTFYAGDFQAVTPLGSGRDADTVLIDGAVSSGTAIAIDSAPVNQNNYLKAGDYMQTGTGTARQLFKVLENVSTDGTGSASVEVWPNIRTSIANNAAVTLQNTKGIFRLASNETTFSVGSLAQYGLSFGAMEAI
jgi:hypothetical protein